jgi:DNA-directed RNA polymerase specialized sigma24 family protein
MSSGLGYEEEEAIIRKLLLIEAVQLLPPKYKAVLALRMAGYSQRECGQIMGLTRAAIGFIQKKSLIRTREILEGLMQT